MAVVEYVAIGAGWLSTTAVGALRGPNEGVTGAVTNIVSGLDAENATSEAIVGVGTWVGRDMRGAREDSAASGDNEVSKAKDDVPICTPVDEDAVENPSERAGEMGDNASGSGPFVAAEEADNVSVTDPACWLGEYTAEETVVGVSEVGSATSTESGTVAVNDARIGCVAKSCPELDVNKLETGVPRVIRTVLELGRATADETDRATLGDRTNPKSRDDTNEDVGRIVVDWLVVEDITGTRVREDDARGVWDVSSPNVDITCEAADGKDSETGTDNIDRTAEDDAEALP
jgi:hypothetical protein